MPDPDHEHLYGRVPKLAGSWIACLMCDEPYRGNQKFEDLLNDRERLLNLVAAVNARHEHGGDIRINLANELWRGLPEHLRRDIEMREAAIG